MYTGTVQCRKNNTSTSTVCLTFIYRCHSLGSVHRCTAGCGGSATVTLVIVFNAHARDTSYPDDLIIF